MEVHHHGHVHHEKKWKEYIFQFFMLFLAVFCGYLAEYQLEHKIEKDRAADFAASLITDLEKDTASINSQILFRNSIYRNADSLMLLLKHGSFNEKPDQVVRNFSTINFLGLLKTYKATIEQLKASGGLRYFKNKKVTTALMDYYNQLDEIDHRIQYIFNYTDAHLVPFGLKHYNTGYNDTTFHLQNNRAAFRNMEEEDQMLLYNISRRIKGLNEILSTEVLPAAFEDAKDLMEMIKKEYRL
jgi:hypothetical protein